MNWIDIVLVVPLLWGAYNGFKKGLISQIFGILGLVVGIWLGIKFPGIAEVWLKGNINDEYLKIVSFVVIFLVVVIITFLLSKLIEKLINFVQLKMLNKLAGVVLGVTKILLFMVIISFILENWDKNGNIINTQEKAESLVYPKLVYTSNLILPKLQEKTEIDISNPSISTILETTN